LARVQFEESEDLIDICYDNVFKAVFARNTAESLGALSKLISALIGQELRVLSLVANEPPVDNLRDRQIRYDINCQTGDKKQVNVEMSLNPDPFEPIRLEFHAGKLFSGQDIRGKDELGSEKTFDLLKPTYQITVLAKRRFFEDGEFFHTFEYYDPEHKVSLGGRTKILTLELSKLDLAAEKPIHEMTAPEHWAYFFRYLTDKTKRRRINEILEQEEGIAMASEVLMTISRDEHERVRLLSELRAELDHQSRLGHARKEGREEGREEGLKEGRKEGIQETARNLKALGVPLEQIAQGTGLSLDDIARL
jgi:predicted transposase/invertase (TIGR01784 family)